MEIIKGKIRSAQKVVIYGPEGIGKSTFASMFPRPLFVDTEGSTNELDVDRVKRPLSWSELYSMLKDFKKDPHEYQTLVIDTADWAEILCTEFVCSQKYVKGIEDIGYGKGYTYLKEAFGKFLNFLSGIVDQGIHVVLTAHAKLSKFEQPDESGSYDRWELKLAKCVAPLVKEWADSVLFINYKTFAVKDENDKVKAKGGKRIMYTQHHPCWDAKNRWGLPEECEFDYSVIAPFVHTKMTATEPVHSVADQKKQELDALLDDAPEPLPQQNDKPVSPGIPDALKRLMEANGVTESDIQLAVANNGYYPIDMPIENYDPDFINGKLIAGWDKFYEAVQYFKSLPYGSENE